MRKIVAPVAARERNSGSEGGVLRKKGGGEQRAAGDIKFSSASQSVCPVSETLAHHPGTFVDYFGVFRLLLALCEALG